MVILSVAIVRDLTWLLCFFWQVFEMQKVTLIFSVVVIEARSRCLALLTLIASKITSSRNGWTYSSIGSWIRGHVCWRTRAVAADSLILNLFKFAENLKQFLLSIVFCDNEFIDTNRSLLISKIRCTWPSWEIAIDTAPVLSEIALDAFKTIKCRHFLWSLSIARCIIWTASVVCRVLVLYLLLGLALTSALSPLSCLTRSWSLRWTASWLLGCWLLGCTVWHLVSLLISRLWLRLFLLCWIGIHHFLFFIIKQFSI